MSDRLGRFRSPEDQARYLERYDRLVAHHWPQPRAELDIPTRFGPTHVRRTGPEHGIPLVLIHPTTGSSLGWHSIIERFTQGRPVYTPDTIGTIGRSVQTAPIDAVDDLVVWLDDVLDGLGLETVHLAGYSEGGWIAGAHAALTVTPSRLATLSLIEPGGALTQIRPRLIASIIARGTRTLVARDKPQAIRDFSAWLNGEMTMTDDEVELVRLAFGSFKQQLPRPKQLADEQLRRITMPTLLLLGGESRIADPDEVAGRARRLLPDVTVEITPGAGHGLAFQRPDQVTSRILEFAAAHDSSSQRA